MPNARDIEMKLPSLDELFSSQEERDDAKLKRIYEIPLDKIDPFPDHPFKVRDDEDMMNLVESIRTNGVLTPATVRKKEDAAFTGKKGSKYTVYDGGQIRYGSGEGGYSNSRKCDLGDDLGSRYSYCVQPSKLSPGTGTVTVDKVIDDDDDKGKWNALRNIIYYSPSYPGYDNNVTNIRSKYYTGTFSTDWGIAHLALSYVYAGRPSDMATFGGTHASDLGSVWTKAKKLGDELYQADSERDEAVPASFKVFICYMSGVQDMIVGYLEAPGHANMKKLSNRTSITDGNNCYYTAQISSPVSICGMYCTKKAPCYRSL